MLTRQGWLAVVAAVISVSVARVFGILELYVIGAGFALAALAGLAIVWLRRPRLTAHRWIHPSVLVAGDTGRVDVRVEHAGAIRSIEFALLETVRRPQVDPFVARLPLASVAAGAGITTGYQLSTTTRGLVRLGPLIVEHRDPLGVARVRRDLIEIDHVHVAPRSYLLDMPHLGQGLLGEHLLAAARRLGPGDFHGLRDYIDGDEPRSIHWKASARSENLLVKEHTTEGLRKCTVVLDSSSEGYTTTDGYERAVTAAASLVHSADRNGLTTRFVTGASVDLRGPDVAPNTLRLLAQIEVGEPLTRIEHDPGEGLGLLIVISGTKAAIAVRAAQRSLDPTQIPIVVTTEAPRQSPIDIAARSDREFVDSWQTLSGRGRLDTSAATR